MKSRTTTTRTTGTRPLPILGAARPPARRVRERTRALWVALALLATGCLDPLVGDAVERESLLLPAGTPVPALETDAALAAHVDANDGVDRLVPRLSAFAYGERVWYWTFGPAPVEPLPIYYLVGDDGAGGEMRLGHPGIVDALPGDAGYSPFWRVFHVRTTAIYAGEVISSVAALQEARAAGLVEPARATGGYVNCPIVHADVRLETGGGAEPKAPDVLYCDGHAASVFGFGPVLSLDAYGLVPVAPVYVLRREGGEPLSEPLRGVDMTGDGDTLDSNNVFAVARDEAGYTPLWQVVEVVVPADTGSIDTAQDETVADFRAASDLFRKTDGAPEPVAGHVVAVHDAGLLLNCPIQATDGGL